MCMHNPQGRTHGRRFALALVAVASFVLVAASCAPAAGRGTEEFVASAEDVIAEIAFVGPNLQPGAQMNFYTVETIGDRFVTLVSASTFGFTALFGQAQTRLTFSAQQRGPVVLLAASGTGANADLDIDRILAHLRTVFPAP